MVVLLFAGPLRAETRSDICTYDGTVTAEYKDSPADQECENLIDQDPYTKYLTFHSSAYVEFDASREWTATEYTLTSANDHPERDPASWTLYGSKDGVNWTRLDVEADQNFTYRLETRTYRFANETPFRLYRLEMRNHRGPVLQLSGWTIYGAPLKGSSGLKDITFSGGEASAEYNGTGLAARNLIDHRASTEYATGHRMGWVEYKTKSPYLYKVVEYALVSASGSPVDDPKSWTLEASNDNATWATLDKRVDQVFAARNQELKYSLENARQFRYYRLLVTSNNGGDSLRLAELKLFGAKGDSTRLPSAGFTSNENMIVAGESVMFKNLSKNATSWHWSFPGGTPSSSTEENPVVRYSSGGKYNVTLSVSNGQSRDYVAKTDYVRSVTIDKTAMADSVKQAFLFAWNNYRNYAWGYDELDPLTHSGTDWYPPTSFYFTPVDGLDTMILMGLKTQADEARRFIDQNLSFNKNVTVSGFEFTIRFLGGLISSYQLTGDPKLLALAKDLGNRLLKEFDSPTGMPYGDINLATGAVGRPVTNPAEIGTRLIEFGALSKLTGDTTYYNVAKRALLKLYSLRSKIGLVGNAIDVTTGQWDGTDCSVGGGIDSYLEYLIKAALLFHDKDCMNMWKTTLAAVNKYLRDSTSTGVWYGHADMNTGRRTGTYYGSLDAFWCDPLCLGGDLKDAEALCESNFKMWNLYGIEPEGFDYGNMTVTSPGYYLRPEIMESTYYLYHYTQDPLYLMMGQVFFDGLTKYCRTQYGFTQLSNVITKQQTDGMPSYFMAETMKYLYLLFAPENTINWNTTIFNTEAHPIQDTWDSLGIDSSRVPTGYALYQNFPNPFNPGTSVRFVLGKAGHVTLTIYNVIGQCVKTVIDGQMSAGEHTVPFYATGLASGVYFCRLQTNGYESTDKMVYVK